VWGVGRHQPVKVSIASKGSDTSARVPGGCVEGSGCRIYKENLPGYKYMCKNMAQAEALTVLFVVLTVIFMAVTVLFVSSSLDRRHQPVKVSIASNGSYTSARVPTGWVKGLQTTIQRPSPG
jgi:hypothetical protein